MCSSDLRCPRRTSRCRCTWCATIVEKMTTSGLNARANRGVTYVEAKSIGPRTASGLGVRRTVCRRTAAQSVSASGRWALQVVPLPCRLPCLGVLVVLGMWMWWVLAGVLVRRSAGLLLVVVMAHPSFPRHRRVALRLALFVDRSNSSSKLHYRSRRSSIKQTKWGKNRFTVRMCL